jgi:hypothetical protein
MLGPMRRPHLDFLTIAVVAPLLFACGPTSSEEPSGSDSTSGGTQLLTDDPARARAFQVPLDVLVRPYDEALARVLEGDDPTAVFGDIALADPASVTELRTRAEQRGARRAEVGEIAMSIDVTRDRGQPESERFDRASVELTAVRPGGVFRFTAFHTELRRMAEAPEEPPAIPDAWAALRDALVESLSGPDCRFVPRLREQDMRGIFPEPMISALAPAMPDQARVDRTCADLWDRQSPHRVLAIRGLKIFLVDDERTVVGVAEATLTSNAGVATLGALGFAD